LLPSRRRGVGGRAHAERRTTCHSRHLGPLRGPRHQSRRHRVHRHRTEGTARVMTPVRGDGLRTAPVPPYSATAVTPAPYGSVGAPYFTPTELRARRGVMSTFGR